mmetsp:Transcript_29648/g.61964  ORF Transcript_29648/g.61964 Transcript_29648/m.61964 type:complete len:115 (+) Transcript_29648:2-346(+)
MFALRSLDQDRRMPILRLVGQAPGEVPHASEPLWLESALDVKRIPDYTPNTTNFVRNPWAANRRYLRFEVVVEAAMLRSMSAILAGDSTIFRTQIVSLAVNAILMLLIVLHSPS